MRKVELKMMSLATSSAKVILAAADVSPLIISAGGWKFEPAHAGCYEEIDDHPARRLARSRHTSEKPALMNIAQPFMAGNNAIRFSKSRQGRQTISFRPCRDWEHSQTVNPDINGWAIVKDGEAAAIQPRSPSCTLFRMPPFPIPG